ncbi:hypothetical protein KL912_000117 [Ogataea haglerorum]|nr:hypothetical protein KL912_000117 [Ogataea haglerorum]
MPCEQKDIDFDSLLNLENQYYQEGFLEGQLEGSKQQFLEGKQIGIQTGFQRLLVLGQYKALVAIWIDQTQQKIDAGAITDDKGKPRQFSKLLQSLTELQMLIDTLFENGRAQVTNNDSDVEKYENVLKRARAKMRSVCPIFGENYNDIEEIAMKVGGTIQTEQKDEW